MPDSKRETSLFYSVDTVLRRKSEISFSILWTRIPSASDFVFKSAQKKEDIVPGIEIGIL